MKEENLVSPQVCNKLRTQSRAIAFPQKAVGNLQLTPLIKETLGHDSQKPKSLLRQHKIHKSRMNQPMAWSGLGGHEAVNKTARLRQTWHKALEVSHTFQLWPLVLQGAARGQVTGHPLVPTLPLVAQEEVCL